MITACATSDGAMSDHELIATRQRAVPTPHSSVVVGVAVGREPPVEDRRLQDAVGGQRHGAAT